jgi:hypothetical protein
MAWAQHGKCESDTAALCKSKGKKTHSKPSAVQHGRRMGTACYVWISRKSSPYGEWKYSKCMYISIYVCTGCVKYKVWMKTSNTPPRHIVTCHVQFNGVLVQQRYRKTKSRPVCTCFLHTEFPLTQWKCHIGAVYFKKQYFYQRKLNVIWNYSHTIFWFLSHTFIRISFVITNKTSETTCLFRPRKLMF